MTIRTDILLTNNICPYKVAPRAYKTAFRFAIEFTQNLTAKNLVCQRRNTACLRGLRYAAISKTNNKI